MDDVLIMTKNIYGNRYQLAVKVNGFIVFREIRLVANCFTVFREIRLVAFLT